jgi:hypothetical protein
MVISACKMLFGALAPARPPESTLGEEKAVLGADQRSLRKGTCHRKDPNTRDPVQKQAHQRDSEIAPWWPQLTALPHPSWWGTRDGSPSETRITLRNILSGAETAATDSKSKCGEEGGCVTEPRRPMHGSRSMHVGRSFARAKCAPDCGKKAVLGADQ